MQDQTLHSKLFGSVALHGAVIELGGEKFTPDATKAYGEFAICHGFPVTTAYGTCFHPGTVANAFNSLKHQVVDYDHQLQVHDRSKNKDAIREDKILGFVAAVEYPRTPVGGWKLGLNKGEAPAIKGVMGVFKNAKKTQQVLGEHLAGRHKWSVSIEANYSFLNSGFVIGDAAKADQALHGLMDEQTPPELKAAGLGYLAVQSAPEELLNCFSFEKGRIVKAWGQCPVSLMMGGINGEAHFAGIGIVRYGAEREAEILQLLASDPDKLAELSETDLGIDYFRGVLTGMESLAEALTKLGS